jgi:uncharacterized protein
LGALENLRKEAKRWLKAIREGNADALERLRRAYPAAPERPGLRDMHHALAREHGHEHWMAMKAAIASAAPATTPETDLDRVVSTFLQSACWDHHTHGAADHRMYDRAAQRHLANHPEIARHDLYCAIVCGNVGQVRRLVEERPAAALEPGGARGWTPILYLSYTRFHHPQTLANALDIATLLLDAGADPNDFYMAGDSEYSCLVGAAGEGEQDSPRQPYAAELYRLLLERGAGPFDIQVLYDTHFSGDMLWWLELTYEQCLRVGRTAEWTDPDWWMLDMGGYGSGAYFVLKVAIERRKPELARWALAHGASPNAAPPPGPHRTNALHSLHQLTVILGETEIAELLARHGADTTPAAARPLEELIGLCMRLNRAGASAFIDRHPEYRRSHLALFEAAKRDRPDALELLLDLGVPLEIADEANTRALHHAAAQGALRAAAFLIDRGAEIDPRETRYGATPIGWAAHGDRIEMLDFLSRYSRNIWTLTFRGYVDRVREILRDDPSLARLVDEEGITPLWWLPDDEDKAMQLVELLIAAGADPSKRNVRGRTAADWARTRGMEQIARRLDGGPAPSAPAVTSEESDEDAMSGPIQPIVVPPPVPSGAPVEMRAGFTMRLYDNVAVPTADVWSMLTACRDGDLARVEALIAACPSLVRCEYNYMPPLHLAVREGHEQIVRVLAGLGAVNPNYRTYPYRETLMTMAADRGFAAIASILEEHSRGADPNRPEDDKGHIEYVTDVERRRFQRMVNALDYAAVRGMLDRRPELALDPFAFWAEGIMSVPANRGDHKMLALLMEYGATVPEITKWGREYYFKRDDTAAFLMERGMCPHHMNCHRTTLLHGMAQVGEIRRARLLLDHGADIDAVDDEFRSTPLGLATRWGREKMVRLLLDRGADRHCAGAEWATPFEWARKKGHAKIARLL